LLATFELEAFRVEAFRVEAFELEAFRVEAFRVEVFELEAFELEAFRVEAFQPFRSASANEIILGFPSRSTYGLPAELVKTFTGPPRFAARQLLPRHCPELTIPQTRRRHQTTMPQDPRDPYAAAWSQTQSPQASPEATVARRTLP
jgi:hypothetical protein